MSAKQIESLARKLKKFELEKDQLESEIESIKDEIKAEMTAREEMEIIAGAWKITWKSVSSSRVDTSALKKELPEIALRYTVTSSSRRFCVV